MITIKMLLSALPLFFVGIIMHECAHYFVARIFNVRSRFGFSGISPAVFHENESLVKISTGKFFWITMSPIPFTFVYLFMFMLLANFDNYMFYGGFYFWIIFAVGFAVFGTWLGSMHDIKVFNKFREFKKTLQI